MTEQIEQNPFMQVLARAVTDEAFRAALLADTSGTLKAQGFEIPEGIEIKAVEDTPAQLHLVLPPMLPEELSDEELEAINGGFFSRRTWGAIAFGATSVLGAPAIVMTGGAAAPLVFGAMAGSSVLLHADELGL